MELLLASTVVLGTPLLLAALGGIVAERGGVLNIGLEGLILGGAFAAAWMAGGGRSIALGISGALLFGLAAGAALGWILVVARADQVVTGIGFNLVMLGLTGYVFGLLPPSELSTAGGGRIAIPGLSQLPWVGILFDQHWLAYVGYVLVPIAWVIVFRTGAGIRLRACGEYAEGARASGVNVVGTRILAMAVSGLLCGLAGAFLVIADTHRFVYNITDGRGYIALAVIILGRWSPLGALGAAALFAYAQGVDLYAQARGLDLPLQLIQALPYVLTLVAAAVLGRKVRPPAEEGRPLMLSK